MGPLGAEETLNYNSRKKNLNVDLSDVATQQIDCQCSPGGDIEGSKSDHIVDLTNTMPVDDTYLLEDSFETQLVNLTGEVVDLAGETQVFDLAGETQVLDDIDCMIDTPNEFSTEFNAEVGAVSKCEETNTTDVVCETQEFLRNNSVQNDGSGSVGFKGAAPVADKDPSGEGPICRGFTTMRAVSIRASGLAAAHARRANSNWQKETCEQNHSSVVGHSLKSGKTNGRHLENSNKCKVGSTAVRQLFREDEDDNHDVPEQLDSENCFTGLSYANSQEPGELSQGHALEFVDRFLDLNFMECKDSFGWRVQKEGSPKVVSAAKGFRDLAKSSILKSGAQDCGIYDWDDTREDDGGGDFFVRKKEIFFQKEGTKQRCLTEPKKSRDPDVGNVTVGDGVDERESTFAKNKSGDPVCSSSGLMLRKLRSNGKSLHSEQNLTLKIPCPDSVGVVTRQAKRTKRITIGASNESSISPKQCSKVACKRGRVLGEAEERRLANVDISVDHETESTDQSCDEKHRVVDFYVPVAHRTRKSITVNCSKVAANSCDDRDRINDVISASARDKKAVMAAIEKVGKVGSTRPKQSNKTCVYMSGASNTDSLDNLRGRRSRQSISGNRRRSERLKRSSEVAASMPVSPNKDHLNNPSTCNDQAFSCLDTQPKKIISHKTVKTRNSRNNAAQCDSYHSPICGASSSNITTPTNCTTPVNNASPICKGDEYHKQSCRKNLSRSTLLKEIDNLVTGQYGGMGESRKRKYVTTIKVLFSQQLDVDVVKQQKKILAQLGGTVASTMSDATHFVADEFVRTKNMLEAIAYGKPVVTHLWIESCGQASCLFDEKNYLLRDARKEKEFGFCLPVSLARACQYPLLQGLKVLVTPNTKPGRDVLVNLVKAVHGLAIERLGKPILKDEKLPNNLLILSCEEDYEACVPFLEKGRNVSLQAVTYLKYSLRPIQKSQVWIAINSKYYSFFLDEESNGQASHWIITAGGAIYSSELLLNGIVKQKLEYERHRLFVYRTRSRSAVWVKRKSRFTVTK